MQPRMRFLRVKVSIEIDKHALMSAELAGLTVASNIGLNKMVYQWLEAAEGVMEDGTVSIQGDS